MVRSHLFYKTNFSKEVEKNLVETINSHPEWLSQSTASSTRAVGDSIQEIVSEKFQEILGDNCKSYSTDFARRAMADLAFEDHDGFHYMVDVKTHRISTSFNMPNLTSVHRIARLYESDHDYFVLLIIEYDIQDKINVNVSKVQFVPIEFISWSCLTIGALGWGQIQIANSNKIDIEWGRSRKEWMLEFCENVLSFYPKEVAKIKEREKYFNDIHKKWKARDF